MGGLSASGSFSATNLEGGLPSTPFVWCHSSPVSYSLYSVLTTHQRTIYITRSTDKTKQNVKNSTTQLHESHHAVNTSPPVIINTKGPLVSCMTTLLVVMCHKINTHV